MINTFNDRWYLILQVISVRISSTKISAKLTNLLYIFTEHVKNVPFAFTYSKMSSVELRGRMITVAIDNRGL